jgi:hypothetical protein
LLLKAIRTLPQREQDVVLAYLLDRIHASATPLPGSGFVGRRMEFSSAPLPQWAAWLIVRRLAEGATADQLASELRLDPEILRASLDDVARRGSTGERVAAILRKVVEGGTIEQAAGELGLTDKEVRRELEPSETLSAAVCAALMGRAALPHSPAGQLGIGPQGPLRTMPVRFPEQQYQRLKDWSEQHDFPMAVVVRGVVERFLDEQQRGPA